MNSLWLQKAHDLFGDREEVFKYVDSPYDIWSNLVTIFRDAYEYPFNEADIRAVYEYAEWFGKQPRGKTAENDLLTIVAVAFYEYIPEIPGAVKDLQRWFKVSEIIEMREIFSYREGDAGYQQMLSSYPKSQVSKAQRKLTYLGSSVKCNTSVQKRVR
ncbi:hypothetical protein [Rubritalea sp.]|uniref:hypothetical protein n=1 Tax=Rubritalea sp. TaxID=2109375 RepID=UPI003EF4A5DE